MWPADAARQARLFLLLCLLIGYLHYRAEGSARGDIPADSDSLAYQNHALSDLHAHMQGRLSLREFLYGSREVNFLPPLHKWSLQLGYLILGLDNLTPYAVSAFWMVVAAFAVFLIVRRITQDPAFAFAAGLLLLGLPASLRWGFMGSRNDWPAAALYLLGFWCLIASDLGRHRTMMAGCGLFWGLGLLAKSSLAGYLAVPVLALAADAVRRRKDLSRAQAENVLVAVLAAVLVSGWFYAAQYRDVVSYYSFWPTVNAANERLQYQLDSATARRLFYVRNWVVQMGGLAIAVTAVGLVGIVRLLGTRRPPLEPARRAAVGWALVFALAPYLVLVPRGDYAPTADVNMLPFQLVLGVTGLWALAGSSVGRAVAVGALLAAAVVLDVARIGEHARERVYAGVDAVRAVHELGDVLERHRYREWRLYELSLRGHLLQCGHGRERGLPGSDPPFPVRRLGGPAVPRPQGLARRLRPGPVLGPGGAGQRAAGGRPAQGPALAHGEPAVGGAEEPGRRRPAVLAPGRAPPLRRRDGSGGLGPAARLPADGERRMAAERRHAHRQRTKGTMAAARPRRSRRRGRARSLAGVAGGRAREGSGHGRRAGAGIPFSPRPDEDDHRPPRGGRPAGDPRRAGSQRRSAGAAPPASARPVPGRRSGRRSESALEFGGTGLDTATEET
ncbi:MAG: hypothetical protein DMF81_12710 [Acidobacteria bacterium]|nr:MAG: hypothetical protein DMF81_12710 [Acidobacteriota bacterium]